MDGSGYFEINVSGQYNEYVISSSISTKIYNHLKKYGLENVWTKALPILGEDFYDCDEKEKLMAVINRIPQPEECLKVIKENFIIERIKSDLPEDYEAILECLNNLIEIWKLGYCVIEAY
jgi:hypothetical protein